MTPLEIATRNLAAIEEQWREQGIDPSQLPPAALTTYETEHDLQILRPEDGPNATLETHNQILTEFSTLLKKRHGLDTFTVTLSAADYLRWLAKENKKNTPENRANFTALYKQN